MTKTETELSSTFSFASVAYRQIGFTVTPTDRGHSGEAMGPPHLHVHSFAVFGLYLIKSQWHGGILQSPWWPQEGPFLL